MPYTAEKPKLVPESQKLRETIVGWGADLDRSKRPGVPKEQYNPGATGAHWDFPERQVPGYDREKSPEHKFLTPVFGTTCPPKGISGKIRKFAYTYSEARAAHWLLLIFADRVDVVESSVRDLLRGRPDNLIQEYGIKSEFTRHGLRSRLGQNRTDVKRMSKEFVFMAGVLGGLGLVLGKTVFGKSALKGKSEAEKAA